MTIQRLFAPLAILGVVFLTSIAIIAHGPVHLGFREGALVLVAAITCAWGVRELLATRATLDASREVLSYVERRGAILGMPCRNIPEALGVASRLGLPSPGQECVACIAIDRRHRVLGSRILSVGSQHAAAISLRDIFLHAMKLGADHTILLHNHTCGDAIPSEADYTVTERVVKAGHIMGIHLVDHIVLSAGSRVSIAASRPELFTPPPDSEPVQACPVPAYSPTE